MGMKRKQRKYYWSNRGAWFDSLEKQFGNREEFLEKIRGDNFNWVPYDIMYANSRMGHCILYGSPDDKDFPREGLKAVIESEGQGETYDLRGKGEDKKENN